MYNHPEMTRAFIIHGTGGYPEENWFPWLKKELKAMDIETVIPQFPTPKNQTPETWFTVISDYLPLIEKDSIMIGHSLGATFLLRVLEKLDHSVAQSIFVAPSIGILPIKYIEGDRPFLSEPFNWQKIRQNAEKTTVFHSEDDPYICIENGMFVAQQLGAQFIKKDNCGHFNAQAGFRDGFPELLSEIMKNRD